jgi:hypothetical protein
MRYEYILYGSIAVLSVDTIIGALLENLYMVMLSIALCFAVFLLRYFKDFIDSFIFKHTNFIQVIDSYEINGDRSAAIRKIGQRYIATSGGVVSAESGSLDKEKVERLISRFSYPFKFSMVVEKMDSKRLVEALQTKRNMRELELSRLDDASKGKGLAKAALIKRAIEQIEHDIKSINGGYAPLRVLYYIMASAEDERRYTAEEEAKAHIKALLGAFDGTLGSVSSVASGDVLLKMLQVDSMVTSGVIDEF